jgi:SAM-dependent methyltransferase
MPYWKKRQSYRDLATAQSYDQRRFSSPLQRIKHRRDVALLRELLAPLPSSALVLDAPCGTGRAIGGLLRAGWRVIGLDASAEMIACARAARIEAPERAESGGFLGFVQAELERLPLRSGSVQALVSLRFFFHVDDRAARQSILREMARVSSGWVVIQERHRESLKHRLRRLRPLQAERAPAPSVGELSEELAQAGLRLERAVPVSSSFSDKLLLLARPAAS